MKSQEKPNPEQAITVEIDAGSELQRIDNFLVKLCKGVPKAHIFRIIRSGEVRVNKGRVDAKYKLQVGDLVRIPPIKVISKQSLDDNSSGMGLNKARISQLTDQIGVLFEDDWILAVNKPSGMAVHGGSGESLGLIECIRISREGSSSDFELVHRIDRETSGVLLISKKRSALRRLQEQLRNRVWKKNYLTVVEGKWPKSLQKVDLPLLKTQAGQKEKKVFVDPAGDSAVSLFRVVHSYQFKGKPLTLLDVRILTGRTHQIRVHTSAKQHPIVGDDRYGNFDLNKELARSGLKRMFLHAARLQFVHPATNESIVVEAPLAPELQRFIDHLEGLEQGA